MYSEKQKKERKREKMRMQARYQSTYFIRELHLLSIFIVFIKIIFKFASVIKRNYR
jgi:hypothetical protein